MVHLVVGAPRFSHGAAGVTQLRYFQCLASVNMTKLDTCVVALCPCTRRACAPTRVCCLAHIRLHRVASTDWTAFVPTRLALWLTSPRLEG